MIPWPPTGLVNGELVIVKTETVRQIDKLAEIRNSLVSFWVAIER